jgi:hypothetical protein
MYRTTKLFRRNRWGSLRTWVPGSRTEWVVLALLVVLPLAVLVAPDDLFERVFLVSRVEIYVRNRTQLPLTVNHQENPPAQVRLQPGQVVTAVRSMLRPT